MLPARSETPMTFTQQLMIWSLRAVVLWAAAELGLNLCDEALRETESWATVREHGQVMQRLVLRGSELANSLIPLQARLDAEQRSSATLHLKGAAPEAAISTVLRDDLTQFGAQGPQAVVATSPVGDTLVRTSIHLTWNEPTNAAPGVLVSLASKRPYLRVSEIQYAPIPGSSMIKGEADLSATLEVAR